jgi:glycosyltransferase involved in cell wall biosynthesis
MNTVVPQANVATGAPALRCIAVIPAHNEAATIAAVVAGTRPFVDVVLVVDDGSSDETSAVAERAGAEVLRLQPNRGKGGALAAGLAAAMARGPELIATLDADGEHVPADLPSLLAASVGAYVVLGYRNVYRSGLRKWLNHLALFWFRLLDPQIRDTICGFRVFRTSALPQLQSDARGFAYEHEVILRAVLHRLRLASVPVQVLSRAGSHVTTLEMIRANNHFDRFVLAHLSKLGLPVWRRVLLWLGCQAGLLLGVPAQKRLEARP